MIIVYPLLALEKSPCNSQEISYYLVMSINPYLEIMRPGTSLLAGLGAVVGAVIAGVPIFSSTIQYLFWAVFLITGAGMAINDYYDLEIDRINAPHRPLPSKRISREQALIFSFFLFSMGLVLVALTNIYCFGLAIFNGLIEFLYAKKFKKWWLLGNVLVSWLTASVFIFGALITFDFRLVWILSLLAFLSNMGREIYKAIEDVKGDKKMKSDTLPVASGIKNSREIAQSFIISAVILSPLPYLSGLLQETYLKIASLGNALFLYSLSQKPKRVKIITKVAMLIVLLAVLLSF